MSWTLPADITDAWIGDDAPTDVDLIQTWIDKAERELRFRVTDLQARIDAEAVADPPSTELKDAAVDVTVAMVTRVFRNPDGIRQRNTTTGPFTESATYGGDVPGALVPSADEVAKLQGVTAGGAFTIDMIPATSEFSPSYTSTVESV
jgi:hypothetical protein